MQTEPIHSGGNLNLKQYLTPMELECIRWLHKGKSAELISEILGKSRKTIERQIASIKRKYNCYTLFQLGQKIIEDGLGDWL